MPSINSPTPDATTIAKGKVQLAGRLAGTAAAPTVKSVPFYYNVKDYGALGNNSADDTAAITAAYTAAATNGGIVYIPAGTYITDPIYATANVSTIGEGGLVSVLKRKPTTTTNTDSIGVLNYHGTTGAKYYGFFIKDLGIDGNKANVIIGGTADPYDTEGISLKYSERFTIENCICHDVNAEGIDLDDSADGVINNCVSYNNGGSGIHVSENTTRMVVSNNVAFGNGTALSRSGIDQFTSAFDNVFVGNITSGNFRGYSIEGSGTSFTANYTSGNTNTSITTGVGKSWTPTFTNLSGGTLNYARYSVGDGYCDYEIKYTLAGAGVANGEMTFSLPITASSTYTVPAPVGTAILGDTGTASYTGVVMYDSATTFRIRAMNASATYTTTATLGATVPFTWAATDIIFVQGRFKVS